MSISFRDLITVLHGMAFGTLFMMAFSGAIGVIGAASVSGSSWRSGGLYVRMFRIYLVCMAALAWLTTLSGTYIIYPWYRAAPPPGTADLSAYPRSLLLSSPSTSEWHLLGMEWKEHVGWLAPIAITMVAYVFYRYGPRLALHRQLRNAVLVFTAGAFLATGVAGLFGAFLNKFAPVRGGSQIELLKAD